jgi:hypothetical protein
MYHYMIRNVGPRKIIKKIDTYINMSKNIAPIEINNIKK